MRGLQLSLNKGQKLRLERALEQLESLSSKANSDASVTVADNISVDYEDAILKGHGTAEMDGRVVATLCGVVERVNKLVYVRTLRARYKPEVGDIIVGRVIERRRTAVDELNMRSIFEENDVICAEVRGFQHDGCLHLQARSQKYGKLKRGQLLTISPYLVKKRKQHFHYLDQYGIDLILGCNGFVWVGEHVEVKDDMVEDLSNKSEQQNVKSWNTMGDEEVEEIYTPPETRQNICRTANAIRVLSTLGFMITVEVVMEVVNLSISLNLDIHEMLGAEFYVIVAEKEAERRSMLTRRR
ncbi:Exosome complex component RRP4 [Sesamum angolense]|uniref:Exosome complex component RRP4 n=1 Tax=Sesamum angolense TaxID=2727404 RepID=A0AAE1X8C4_9LAMI|nr:Exosome complex component RRP4 [Sesamum angolense]